MGSEPGAAAVALAKKGGASGVDGSRSPAAYADSPVRCSNMTQRRIVCAAMHGKAPVLFCIRQLPFCAQTGALPGCHVRPNGMIRPG